jgi:predicted acetyltransferase
VIELDKNGFKLQHLETEEDVRQNLMLMRVVFGERAGIDKLVQKLIDHHPSMTLHDFLVVKHEDKVVASVALIPVTWSVGDVQLKVAELGMVATLPEYRRRGLIRQLVDEYHRQVGEQGYDLSVLEGIPYFYRQFGYEYAVPLLEETRIRLAQVPQYESKISIRPFTLKDLPRAVQLLKLSQRKFYVHSVRSPQIWGIQHKTKMASDPEPFEAYAVEEEGEALAYFRMRENPDEKELLLTEVTDVDQRCAQTVLNFLKIYGETHGLETLAACVSYQEPFSQHLVAIGATRRLPTYAWQIRISDYAKIFWKLKSLFEKRLAGSTYRRLTDTLNFNFRKFTIRMTLKDGEVTDVQRIESGERSPLGFNPLVFVKLLLGDQSRDELESAYPDCRVDASCKHLVDVLFPRLPSYIHSAY